MDIQVRISKCRQISIIQQIFESSWVLGAEYLYLYWYWHQSASINETMPLSLRVQKSTKNECQWVVFPGSDQCFELPLVSSVRAPGHNGLKHLLILVLYTSSASPLILFSSLFPYLSSPLVIFCFENRPTPFPGWRSLEATKPCFFSCF